MRGGSATRHQYAHRADLLRLRWQFIAAIASGMLLVVFPLGGRSVGSVMVVGSAERIAVSFVSSKVEELILLDRAADAGAVLLEIIRGF